MTKVHLKQGKDGTAACAVQGVRQDGTIIRNSRRTYQHMDVVVVGPEDFRATPAKDRCSHCGDRFTPMMNARRAKSGKPAYADALTKRLA